MPSREHVRRAKAAIKRVADLELFFEKLTSPDWITPLQEEGLFQEPWEPQREGQYVSFPFWPQSKFLARMAAQAPDLVLGIIQRIPITENVRIHEDYVDAAFAMPPATAAKLVPMVQDWLASPYQLLLPMKLGKLLGHLTSGGEISAALQLATALLKVEPDQRRGRPHARFEDYFYGEILKKELPSLVAAEPHGALRVLMDALQQAVEAGRVAGVEDAREDFSSVWQPAVEEHAQNNDYDIRPLLVASLRNAAEKVGASAAQPLADVFRALDQRPWKIFSRIGLHLVASFPERDMGLAKEIVSDKARADDPTYHHEYWRLAEAIFPRLSIEEQEAFLQRLESERAIEEAEADGRPTPELVERGKRLARLWLFRRLTLLKGHLPASGQARLQELEREFSAIEHPDFLSYSTGLWTGPTSPKSVEALEAMTVDELVEYLRNWRPSGQLMDHSPEGLSRALAPTVAKNPETYAACATAFTILDPTYVRAVVDGLRQARKARRAFDWEPVLDLCEWVVNQPRIIPARVVGRDHDDTDPDWGWTRKEIAGLLDDGFNDGEGQLPQRLRDRVWSVLAPLTDDPDPTPEHEGQYGGDNMDPLTLSINTVRGVAMHAVVKYALWVFRHLESQEDKAPLGRGFEEIPGVRAVLEDHLRIDRDPSLATRAVYGQWLPWLHLLDPNWARMHVATIFPRDAAQRPLRNAAWGSYLLYSGVFNDIYSLLRDEYAFAIDHIGRERFGRTFGDRPDDRLVDHLMVFYCRGLIALLNENDLLQRFYRMASAEFREHALSFLGHSLQNDSAEALSEQVRARFEEFLDFRIKSSEPWSEKAKELAAFGWWFGSGKLDPEWALSRLVTILRSGRKIEAEHLVVKQLAADASRDLPGVVEALRWVVEVDTNGWGFSLWADDGRDILQRALQHDSDDVRELARHTIDLLAARGNRTFVDLLAPAGGAES